ncbi:unnamed protein product [Symbiodinium necroappetens]|uniref:Uncharacterized protein n=1 Tax=Symbiodinium necroappetens TaxID=1628268 RepID=A0A813BMD3_9DINO|nr:unnamed protein product [Symbiodinium necroappetens]
MPNANSGRRRRTEWDYGGGRWQWRPQYTGRRQWSNWEDFNVHRGEDLLRKYRMEGEELYNRAFQARVPECQGLPTAMATRTEEYWNHWTAGQMVMQAGMGWGGFTDAPAATLPSPCPISHDVQLVIDNILRLQCMAPEQAAKALKDTAALQGPYQD